ncbi:GH35 family beta-galactosidase [Croceivirga radicis]|uniref:GH35 family beta-galactosidase n=1 Tax=Croceivirga radicis TaxID=1929488 RepID=UPI0009B22582|nr:DUF5597 domain-containing protein [Croceivirga radicis]
MQIKLKTQKTLILYFTLFWSCLLLGQSLPRLSKIGNKDVLLVNNAPYLILGGELGNSTATSKASMSTVWPRLKELNLNTVLVPIYWELLEPEPNQFNFDLVDELIHDARTNNLKLVFLWFGSWKNSMSSHVPAWVKTNYKKYPRAKDDKGNSQEILSPFYRTNLEADLNAYTALMRHIKEVDGKENTVIMMQPENEIGMLPVARDHSPLANKKYAEPVPDHLMEYLLANREKLNPEFNSIWAKNGYKKSGNWAEVFGEGIATEELFMAYYFAKYTNSITQAGKEIYPIPAFVNAALNAPGKAPGVYPSAGPLPHLLDIWKAASPAIDFYSPDFYNPDFEKWNNLYTRQNNPLFIPEHRFDNTVAAKAIFTIGKYQALGFSPFAIEQNPNVELKPKEILLAETYKTLGELAPVLLSQWGQNKIKGVLLDKENNTSTFILGDYEFTASHTHNLGWDPKAKDDQWEQAAALIVQTAKNEFYFLGFGTSLTFKNLKNNKTVGILKAESGHFENNTWKVFRHLNGDQTHQGRHIRAFLGTVSLQRFTLYEYE